MENKFHGNKRFGLSLLHFNHTIVMCCITNFDLVLLLQAVYLWAVTVPATPPRFDEKVQKLLYVTG